MKALQTALLVAVGAVAGFMVMKMWQDLHSTDDPLPLVAQVERAAPATAQPAVPPRASSPAGQPKPESVPSAALPTHVPARDSLRNPIRDHTGRAYRAAPDPPAESRNSGAGVSPAQEAPEPAPLLAAPQDSPTPLTPLARTELENVTPVPPSPPEPHRVTLNAGMLIPVRLVDGLSTERNKPGDTFTATLVKELVADDFVIAERGARVEGRVVECDPGGKPNRVAGLTVELTRIETADGQRVAIRTETFQRRAAVRVDAGRSGAGTVATLPSEVRIPFRLGIPVTLTERAQ
jgi:hypothetical protein